MWKKNVFYYNNNFSCRLTSSPTVFVLASVAGICLILMISTEMRERNAFSSKDLSVFWQKKKQNTFFLQRTNCFVSPPVFSFSLLLSPLERGMIHRIYYMVDYWSNYIYMNTTWFTPKQCFMRMDRFKIQPLFRLMCLCVNTFLTFHPVSPQQIK